MLRRANFYDMFIDPSQVLFDPYDNTIYDAYGLHTYGGLVKFGAWFAQKFASGGTIEVCDPKDPLWLSGASLNIINPTNKSTLVKVLTGTNSPQNAVAAPAGSLYLRQNNYSQSLYVKMTGTDSLGWGEILCNPTYEADSDIDNYLSRAGALGQAEAYALTNLVLGLKANGLWSRLDALYPFLGSSSNACSQNLVSSAHPITWSTQGITFNTSGVTSDGAAGSYGVADYGRVFSTVYSKYATNSASFGFFSKTATATFYAFAMGGVGDTKFGCFFDATRGGSPWRASTYLSDNTVAYASYAGMDETGPTIVSRTDSNSVSILTRNGITSSNATSTAVPSSRGVGYMCAVGANGEIGYNCAITLRCAFVGAGYSTYEMGLLSGLLEQFDSSITNGITPATADGYATISQLNAITNASGGGNIYSASNNVFTASNTFAGSVLVTNKLIAQGTLFGKLDNLTNSANGEHALTSSQAYTVASNVLAYAVTSEQVAAQISSSNFPSGWTNAVSAYVLSDSNFPTAFSATHQTNSTFSFRGGFDPVTLGLGADSELWVYGGLHGDWITGNYYGNAGGASNIQAGFVVGTLTNAVNTTNAVVTGIDIFGNGSRSNAWGFNGSGIYNTNIVGTFMSNSLSSLSLGETNVVKIKLDGRTGIITGNGAGITNLPSSGGGRTIIQINTASADQFYVLPSPGSTEYAIVKTNAAFALYLSYSTTTNTISGDNVIVDCVPLNGSWYIKW